MKSTLKYLNVKVVVDDRQQVRTITIQPLVIREVQRLYDRGKENLQNINWIGR